jgi:ribosomal protein L37AE/L43A
MIDRQGSKIVWECDSCDETFDSEEGEEFATAWARAKREGWKSKKIGTEWLHGCPKCGV